MLSIQILNMQIVLMYPLKYVYSILNAIAAFYSDDSQNGCNFKNKLWRLKILRIDKCAENMPFCLVLHVTNQWGGANCNLSHTSLGIVKETILEQSSEENMIWNIDLTLRSRVLSADPI